MKTNRPYHGASLTPKSTVFQKPVLINHDEINGLMDRGEYTFVLVIPKIMKNLLQQRAPELQLLVDATSVSQAGLGASFIQQVVTLNGELFQQNNLSPSCPCMWSAKCFNLMPITGSQGLCKSFLMRLY